jgi:hypothetical protein
MGNCVFPSIDFTTCFIGINKNQKKENENQMDACYTFNHDSVLYETMVTYIDKKGKLRECRYNEVDL